MMVRVSFGREKRAKRGVVGRLLERLLACARPKATVAADWSTGDLLAMSGTWALDLIRGSVKLLGAKGSRLRFCERGVSVFGRRWCHFGKWLLLERYVSIRARGGSGVALGDYVVIGTGSVLEVCSGIAESIGAIRIGRRSSLGDYCYIGGAGGVAIEDSVIIGQYVSMHSENHNFDGAGTSIREQGVIREGIRIESDCWIGAGVKILDGVTIGSGSVIGAGAVVTRTIPPRSVAAGVPAKVMSRRREAPSQQP